mgnify:CR=1 FL=1
MGSNELLSDQLRVLSILGMWINTAHSRFMLHHFKDVQP